MKITKISYQVKNPERVNIFIDNKYSFSLDLNQLLESKLKSGTEITEQDLKNFQKMSADGKLKMRTLEWLTLRPHSAKELSDYLKRKKVDKEQIEQWTCDFQERGYQNDEQFAIWWARHRRNKNKSSAFIRQELKSKGINDETIAETLSDSSSEKEALAALIAKKRSKYQNDKKLTEYLLRQGYRYSLIKEVLAE
jgi:regulatory protein